MAYRVEFRGGPRNAEIEEFASTADVPNEIEMDYVDANLQGSRPLQRVGHYRRDGAAPYLLWHVDHARGAGKPLDIDTPEDGFEAHQRPREDRQAARPRR